MIRKSSLFLSIVFSLSPLIAFPCIWIEIYNRRKYAIVLLSLFLAICAYMYVPSGDLYRYWLAHQAYIDMGYFDIFTDFTFDYLIPSLSFVLAKLGFNHAFIRFVLVLLCSLLYFNMIYEFLNFVKSKVWYFLLFLISFFLFPYFAIISGIRYGTASVLFLLAIYHYLYKENSMRGYLYMILSILTHYSFIVLVLGMLLAKTVAVSRKILLLTGIGLLLINSQLLHHIGLFEGLSIYSKIEAYTAGEDYINTLSPLLKFVINMGRWVSYPLFFLLLFKIHPSKMRDMAYIVLLILCMFFPFITIFNRYMFVAILVSFLCYLKRPIWNSKLFLYILFAFSMLSYSSGILANHRLIIMSNYQSLLYTPYPLLFGKTYGEEWINEHFNENGGVIKY